MILTIVAIARKILDDIVGIVIKLEI